LFEPFFNVLKTSTLVQFDPAHLINVVGIF